MVFFSDMAQRFGITHLLLFHHEVDGMSAFTATKTFVNTFHRRNVKGRGFLVVKRTKPNKIYAPFFKGNIIANHLFHSGRFKYFIYVFLVDQNEILFLCFYY